MIDEYNKKDVYRILNVINDASLKYKGVIPEEFWHEPYMTEKELISEFNNGVRMFGFNKDKKLVGVMGIQENKKRYFNKACLYINSLSRDRYRNIIVEIFV